MKPLFKYIVVLFFGLVIGASVVSWKCYGIFQAWALDGPRNMERQVLTLLETGKMLHGGKHKELSNSISSSLSIYYDAIHRDLESPVSILETQSIHSRQNELLVRVKEYLLTYPHQVCVGKPENEILACHSEYNSMPNPEETIKRLSSGS